MAASRLPQPGTEFGPCENECKHIDCKQTREMAESICHFCQKPVGYETRFYQIDTILGLQFVHAFCYEESLEREDFIQR